MIERRHIPMFAAILIVLLMSAIPSRSETPVMEVTNGQP